MGKLQIKCRARNRRCPASPIRRAKNRAGIMESMVRICGDCGEEFCAGEDCGDILYDSFIRVVLKPQPTEQIDSADAAAIIANMGGKKSKPNSRMKRNYFFKGSVPKYVIDTF